MCSARCWRIASSASLSAAAFFVRILSDGHLIENIHISDIVGGCRAHAVNMGNFELPIGRGDLRNIYIRDVRVVKRENTTPHPLVPINQRVQNLVMEQFERIEEEPSVEAPTLVIENSVSNTVEFTDSARADRSSRQSLP